MPARLHCWFRLSVVVHSYLDSMTVLVAEVRALFHQHPALEVDTDLEREMAESVARQAPGVAKVVNSIGLRGGR